MTRVERAMAMETKKVMAMAKKRVIVCKSHGNCKEDGNGKQQ